MNTSRFRFKKTVFTKFTEGNVTCLYKSFLHIFLKQLGLAEMFFRCRIWFSLKFVRLPSVLTQHLDRTCAQNRSRSPESSETNGLGFLLGLVPMFRNDVSFREGILIWYFMIHDKNYSIWSIYLYATLNIYIYIYICKKVFNTQLCVLRGHQVIWSQKPRCWMHMPKRARRRKHRSWLRIWMPSVWCQMRLDSAKKVCPLENDAKRFKNQYGCFRK